MRRHVLSALIAVLAAAAPASGQVRFLEESFDYDENRPAAGHWLGNIQVGENPPTWGSLVIECDEEGEWSASITLIAAMALGAPCTEVRIEDRSVALVLPASGQPRMSGTVSPDGQRLAGSLTFGDPGADHPLMGTFEFARTPRTTDLPAMHAYSGELRGPGLPPMALTFVFAQTPGGNWVGHLDVPAQGLLGFPLINVHRSGDAITAEVASVPFPATLNGTLDEAERRLTGRFKQGPYDLEVDFALDEGYAGPAFNRPQHPKLPYPYLAQDVTIEHPNGHILAGTLTVPTGDGPFPAAILITGSGAQDRDETIFGHKPFLVIADHLTRNGIAVLRFDDRGVGGSTGSFAGATTEDLAGDVVAAMKFLGTVEAVDPSRVGLIGHSEGGLIAPMVAGTTEGVSFIVLLAGPGVRGDDLLRVQGKLILEAGGADEETIARTRLQQEKFFELVLNDADEETLREALRPMIEAEFAAMGLEGEQSEQLEQMIETQAQLQASPWMRFFITYDPRPALAKVRCPVLALNGTLDLQVWHEQNLPEIEKAIKEAGGDVTVRRYEKLNHLFQPAETGSITEYGVIETTFDEQVLEDMVTWIKLKTGKRADG
ncbi:MAG: alpha/beta hydrolase family protein [Planctomycetota bacterium]|jgi:pimeloyl-ACP methyl ester carboxylesterase